MLRHQPNGGHEPRLSRQGNTKIRSLQVADPNLGLLSKAERQFQNQERCYI